MKQPNDMARAQSIVDAASIAGQFIDRLFRKRAVPPPDGWSVELRFTPLGGVQMWIPTSVPSEVRSAAYKVVPVLAWLYPGPGEALAQRRLDSLLRAIGNGELGEGWSFNMHNALADDRRMVTAAGSTAPEKDPHS